MATLEDEVKSLRERINELSVDIDNAFRMNTPQRIVCKLIKIAHRESVDGASFKLPMTKGTLALHVGIEHETMSRALHKLPYYGVSVAGRTVVFANKGLMDKLVCSSCAGRATCKAFGSSVGETQKGRD